MKITNRHLRKLRYIAPVFCSMAVLSTQLQAGPTIQLNGDEQRDGMADSGNLGYVGGNTRIGVSINRDLEGQVDVNQIIMEDDSSATSAEGWFGYKIKDDDHNTKGVTGGGVKLNHQWVNDEQDTVHKVFGAYDQDTNDRAKATIGYGQETEDLFWSGHVSKSISDDVVNGQHTTRAYDYGVGAQVGTFLDSTLTRIRGGLDYEFGTEFADGEDRPGKATLSAGIEQFFHDSPHSITLDVSGNQVSGGADTENSDFGARLGYRYEFGGDGVYRSATGTSRRRVEIPGTPGRPGRAGVPAIPPTPAIAGTPGTPGRPAIPATRGTPGRAAIPGRPGRAAIPPRYERRAVSAPGHEFVKTTMKLENETFFKLNSSKLTESAKRNLDKIVGQIRGHGYLGAIRITGNTCGLGDPAYDQRLSENRANSVRDYLVDKGFNPSHLVARGLGKGSPKYDRRDDDFRNRRVDLEYVTERNVKKAANKTQYRSVLVQEGRPAVAAIPGRPAVAAIPGRPGRPAIPARPGTPGRAGSPGRPAIPAIPATPGTPSRFVWRTEVVPSAPIWIQRAIRNTISHNKTISTYTTRTATKLTATDSFRFTDINEPLDVLANDDTGTTLFDTTQPANGTVTIVNGRIVYVPNAGFSGTDTFTYRVQDEDGNLSEPTTVNIEVPAILNNAPTALDDNGDTNPGTSVVIDVLDNDEDLDGDTLTIVSMSNPSGGGTVQQVNGGIEYTPAAGFTGTDTFTYTITDGNNNQSTATVNVVVDAVNPVANADQAMTDEGTAVTINVVNNDIDNDGDGNPLTVTDSGSPGSGTTSIVNNQIVYTPAAGFTGTDTFTYEITDGNGNTTTALVTVEVKPANADTVPVADNDEVTTPEDTAITIPVLLNDSDQDGDTLSILSATNPTSNNGSSVSVIGNNIVYTPAAGFSGQDTFTYTIEDPAGNTDTATVTVNITPAAIKYAPTASNDAGVTPVNTPITIDVFQNDGDLDGDAISITQVGVITPPASGSTSYSGGNITYTPNTGFVGTDTFTYTITDGDPTTADATATVTIVVGTKQGPVAVDDNETTLINTPVTFDALGDDSDPDNDAISITQVGVLTAPTSGTTSYSGNNITYTPNTGFTGTDTFSYTITDTDGNTTNAMVTIEVAPTVKQGPTAVDDDESTPFNTAITFDALGDDSDPDGDAISITQVGVLTPPSSGSTSFSGNNITYTPNTGFSGTDTFSYTITDTDGNTTDAMVTVEVKPAAIKYAPTASNDEDVTPVNTPITINVFQNDGDLDGDAISITQVGVITPPASGSTSYSGGNITYTPNTGFVGTDTFTYTITDGDPTTADATATVTIVVGTKQGPVAVDDNETTLINTPVTFDALGDDSDPDNDAISITQVGVLTAPTSGTTSYSGNNITYTPNTGFTGTDTFSYTITDTDGNTTNAMVTIEVAPAVKQGPTAVDDNENTPFNTAITFDALGDDSDPDGDAISITQVGVLTPPSSGSTSYSGNNITYTPNNGFSGTDTFSYTITDTDGNTTDAMVTIEVAPAVKQGPNAVDDNENTPFNTAITFDALGDDSDPDGDAISITQVGVLTPPSSGSTSYSGNNITYTPITGFSGTDTFSYTITDTDGNTTDAMVTIEVAPAVKQGPTAVDDNENTAFDTAITFDALGDDSDPDGDAISITQVGVLTPPSSGSTSYSGNNITYTPNAGFSGTDTFSYTITDTDGNTTDAMVTVEVAPAPVNQNPDANDDWATTPYETTITINVAGNDTDPENGSTTCVQSIVTPTGITGTVTIAGNGTDITYVPAPGFSGTETFDYVACDGNGGTDTATVTVVVDPAPVNQPPTANDNGNSTLEDTPVTLWPLGNDNDPESDTLTITGTSSPVSSSGSSAGTVTFTGTTIDFTPAPGFTGTATFTYTINDGTPGNDDTATITVEVNPTTLNAVDDPDAIADFETPEVIHVLNNDVNPEGTQITVCGIVAGSGPFNGTVAPFGSGAYKYTPNNGYSGPDSFVYTACDLEGDTDTALVTIDVHASKLRPAARNTRTNASPSIASIPAMTVNASGATSIDIASYLSDANGDSIYIAIADSFKGSTNFSGTVLQYTPNPSVVGTGVNDNIYITVSDGKGGMADGVISVYIP